MKILKLILTVVAFVSIPVLAFSEPWQDFARLSLAEGDVQIRIADTDDWVPATVNTPLYEGDSIWTPEESRAEIQVMDGSIIRLDERSSLSIVTVDDNFLQFYLGMGRIYVRTGESRNRDLQFDLFDSSVRVYGKTRLRIDVTDRDEEEISVFSGDAYVETGGNGTRVLKGELLVVAGSRTDIYPLDEPDSWDRWNRKLDDRIGKLVTKGYLPEELVVYEGELSLYGEWIDVRGVGRVWRPTVGIDADWAPYRSGRWIWRGNDYIWIPAEPWGWAPSHYGRWSFVAGFGWCWVPPERGDVYWAPAYVGWITTSTYVGWVPLAPGEKYYGHGHYGRHSVDIRKGSAFKFDRKHRSYRHEHLNNAVTGLNRSSFVSGSGTYRKIDAGSLSREKIVPFRPEPAPHAKEVRMPQVKQVPPSKLPPPKVARIPVKELKERLHRKGKDGDRSLGADQRRPDAGKAVRTEKTEGTATKDRSIPSRIAPHEGKSSPVIRHQDRVPRSERHRPDVAKPVQSEKQRGGDKPQDPRSNTPDVKSSPEIRHPDRVPGTEQRRPDAEKPVRFEKQRGEKSEDQPASPRTVTPDTKRPQSGFDSDRRRVPAEHDTKPSPVKPAVSNPRAPAKVDSQQENRKVRTRTPATSVPPATKQAETPADRTPPGKERRDPSAGRKGKGEKPAEKQVDSKESEDKSGQTQERKLQSDGKKKQREDENPPRSPDN